MGILEILGCCSGAGVGGKHGISAVMDGRVELLLLCQAGPSSHLPLTIRNNGDALMYNL